MRMSMALSLAWQRSGSQPVAAANFCAASVNVVGGRRVRRCLSSKPISSSIHTESGCERSSASERESGISSFTAAANQPPSVFSLSAGSVARSRLSPITASLVTCVPNKREATSGTDAAGSAFASSLTIVADVPIETGGQCRHNLSRIRRTSIATSAPCRPRYRCEVHRGR